MGREVARWLVINRCQQPQIVEGGDAAIDQSQNRQPDNSGAERGGEDVELSEETGGKRNPNQRKKKEGHRPAKQGRAVGKTAVIGDREQLILVAARMAQDGEDSYIGYRIGRGVEDSGCDSFAGECGKGHQKIASMGDRGIGQHALDVLLT